MSPSKKSSKPSASRKKPARKSAPAPRKRPAANKRGSGTSAAKKAVRKPAAAKKSAAKKRPVKKVAVKKSAAKKPAAKKSTERKSAGEKAAATKSAGTKTAAGAPSKPRKSKTKRSGAQSARTAKPSPKSAKSAGSGESTQAIKSMAQRPKHTPAVFKLPSRKTTPIVFTLEDVREALKTRRSEDKEPETTTGKEVAAKTAAQPATGKQEDGEKAVVTAQEKTDRPPSRVGAASITDILGFKPGEGKKSLSLDAERVPKKWMRYYKLLLELRDHVREGLDTHSRETLKRSSKEDSGDLSSYSQHIADAGTETFDRDFALSLVSTEQEALAEIEGAIERIYDGTYGVCEVTGKPIPKERLLAVPFTRFSVEGQSQHERTKRRASQRTGAFVDFNSDEAVAFSDDDNDD